MRQKYKLNEMRALAGWHLIYTLALCFLFCGDFYYSINPQDNKRQSKPLVSSLLYNNIDLIRCECINWHLLALMPVIRGNHA